MDRASDYGSEGWGFDSLRARYSNATVSVGSCTGRVCTSAADTASPFGVRDDPGVPKPIGCQNAPTQPALEPLTPLKERADSLKELGRALIQSRSSRQPSSSRRVGAEPSTARWTCSSAEVGASRKAGTGTGDGSEIATAPRSRRGC